MLGEHTTTGAGAGAGAGAARTRPIVAIRAKAETFIVTIAIYELGFIED